MTMTPQERDVIAGIFDRLKQAANQPRDPEAERFIADRLREQPYAPYAMAQAVYVQEQALTNLQAQVEELQAQVRELQERPPQAAPAQAGGFLSGIFGGGAQAPARPGSVPSFPQRAGQAPSGAWTNQQPMRPSPQPGMMGAAPQQAGPWTNQAPPQPAGGGFMASALTTAAGVAGGLVLGNVLTNAFGGGSAKAAAPTPAPESTQAKDDSAGKDDSSKGDSTPESQQAADDQGADDQAPYDQANFDEPYDPDYDDGNGGDDGDWT
jgi:hypothetical protein